MLSVEQVESMDTWEIDMVIRQFKRQPNECFIPVEWLMTFPNPTEMINKFLATGLWEKCYHHAALLPKSWHIKYADFTTSAECARMFDEKYGKT